MKSTETLNPLSAMTVTQIARYFDHTLLRPDAGMEQFRALCSDAREWNFAAVCVPSSWVSFCAQLLEDAAVETCSVVGFPHGNSSSQAKCDEARSAIQAGAGEVDVVMPYGRVLGGEWDYLRRELAQLISVRESCPTRRGKAAVVKIILENAALRSSGDSAGNKLIQEVCGICSRAGVDYVKTGTGFYPNGAARVEDVEIMLQSVDRSRVRVKAAGGIRSLADAHKFITAGASRLGCSACVEILKGLNSSGGY